MLRSLVGSEMCIRDRSEDALEHLRNGLSHAFLFTTRESAFLQGGWVLSGAHVDGRRIVSVLDHRVRVYQLLRSSVSITADTGAYSCLRTKRDAGFSVARWRISRSSFHLSYSAWTSVPLAASPAVAGRLFPLIILTTLPRNMPSEIHGFLCHSSNRPRSLPLKFGNPLTTLMRLLLFSTIATAVVLAVELGV